MRVLRSWRRGDARPPYGDGAASKGDDREAWRGEANRDLEAERSQRSSVRRLRGPADAEGGATAAARREADAAGAARELERRSRNARASRGVSTDDAPRRDAPPARPA